MNNNLYKELFDFDTNNIKKIYVSKNEIYNQLLLYIFFSINKNLLLVVPTLNEATEIYNEIKNYIDDVYLFPEDDFMTKKAIASSPELLFMRSNLLNKFNDDKNKIIIVHLNSFIRKLPNPIEYINKKINIKINDKINRNDFIKKLIEIGYKKESVVYNTSDFAVRGFIIDIFPINEENPIRIELFDDEIESIKYFDIINQRSIKEIKEISICSIKDDFGSNDSSIRDYINNGNVIFHNVNQLKNQEKMIIPQLKYLEIENSVYKVSSLINKEEDIFIDTINNKDVDLKIEAKSIDNYNSNKEAFFDDIVNNNGILYSKNKILNNEIKKYNKNINIIENSLNNGFIYKNNYYYSEYDLTGYINKKELIKNNEFGTKISSIDSIKPGDYVVHRKSGIGIYMGITTIEKKGLKKDYLLIQYKGNDKLYMPVEDISKLYKYSAKEGARPTINKLNSIEWTKTKLKIKERIKNITGELLKIYQERNKATIEPFKKDDEEQLIFESEFGYEETTDQLKCSLEIKKDQVQWILIVILKDGECHLLMIFQKKFFIFQLMDVP